MKETTTILTTILDRYFRLIIFDNYLRKRSYLSIYLSVLVVVVNVVVVVVVVFIIVVVVVHSRNLTLKIG